MRIIQVIGSFSRGDAIGNHIWKLHKKFQAGGYISEIYSQCKNEKQQLEEVHNIQELKSVEEDDVIILHMCIGNMVNKYVLKFKCRRIMIYHNITPPEFMKNYDVRLYRFCKRGYKQLKQLAGKFERVIAVSEYNKRDLLKAGYKEPIEILSSYLMIPFDDYRQEPDTGIMEKYDDGKRNFLFVGRVVPNKKHEDIIRVFAYYQKHIDPNVRLILVGNTGMQTYADDLKKYVKLIGTKDVIFTGSVSFAEIIAYYRVADIFLCMSEHEGFCVPLIEAMMFDVPVVAYAAAAVGDTMKQAGVLMHNKEPDAWGKVIKRIFNEENVRGKILLSESVRIQEIMRDKNAVDSIFDKNSEDVNYGKRT